MNRLIMIFAFLASNILLSACSETFKSANVDEVNALNQDEGDLAYSLFDVNKHKLNKLVCDPMGSGETQLMKGLKAELYYTNGKNYDRVQDYFDKGIKAQFELFYSQLNVPTRLFQKGFPTQTGELVKDDDGNELNEYFALKFNTVLKLKEDDKEGLYEFAVLSDDGTLIKYKDETGNMKILVNNDGDHPTKLGCSTTTIEMTRQTELYVEVEYYQGPRYHISLVPLWRHIEGNREKENLCGKYGNSLYFDYNNNSEPQQAYLDLINREWKVWDLENFHLPSDEEINPCHEGETATIKDLRADSNLDGGFYIRWSTDIPTTSQLRIINKDNGEESITDSDNILRTEHSIFLTKLKPGNNYSIQAISISETYGKTISSSIDLTP
ncbi:MAG: hypothetical protein KDD58_04825 [Bdellovibrionales bacterium]|nr:hypothetical protein [Bdellovibrionales bacterium]